MKNSIVALVAVVLMLIVYVPASAQKVITIDGQPLNIPVAQIGSARAIPKMIISAGASRTLGNAQLVRWHHLYA